jgi:hypothetical protein
MVFLSTLLKLGVIAATTSADSFLEPKKKEGTQYALFWIQGAFIPASAHTPLLEAIQVRSQGHLTAPRTAARAPWGEQSV